jgi:hypothetical protein
MQKAMQRYTRLMFQMLLSDLDLRQAFSISEQTNTSVERTLIERFHVPKSEIGKRLKSMASLDVQDSSVPKLGYMRIRIKDIPEFIVRVTMLPTEDGSEDMVLKIPTK